MLDLTEALRATETLSETRESLHSVLFYQSEHCHSLVKEVFSFESLGVPDCQAMAPASWQDFFANNRHRLDLVLIELTECDDVVARVAELAPQIPNTASVVIIGKEDAISTIRSLKNMGFYYVFWPVVKAEMSDFMRHVVRNHHGGKGLGKERKAKRIAVVGAKGGVGCSLIACELASFLHKDARSKVLLVDHNYTDSNLDVLLGMDEYDRLDMHKSSVQISQLDEDSAYALLQPAGEGISLLAVDGLKATVSDSSKHTDAMVTLLLRRFNLVVEDLSASREFPLDYQALCEHYDLVVVVADPTVSAVRSAKRLIHRLDLAAQNSLKTPRTLVVLNQHRTFQDGVLFRNEIEQQLKRSIDLEVNYEKTIPSVLLSGKRFTKRQSRFSAHMADLAGLVLGRSVAARQHPLIERLAGLKQYFIRN